MSMTLLVFVALRLWPECDIFSVIVTFSRVSKLIDDIRFDVTRTPNACVRCHVLNVANIVIRRPNTEHRLMLVGMLNVCRLVASCDRNAKNRKNEKCHRPSVISFPRAHSHLESASRAHHFKCKSTNLDWERASKMIHSADEMPTRSPSNVCVGLGTNQKRAHAAQQENIDANRLNEWHRRAFFAHDEQINNFPLSTKRQRMHYHLLKTKQHRFVVVDDFSSPLAAQRSHRVYAFPFFLLRVVHTWDVRVFGSFLSFLFFWVFAAFSLSVCGKKSGASRDDWCTFIVLFVFIIMNKFHRRKSTHILLFIFGAVRHCLVKVKCWHLHETRKIENPCYTLHYHHD